MVLLKKTYMTYDREERKREKSKINNKKGGLFIKKRKEKRERGRGGTCGRRG